MPRSQPVDVRGDVLGGGHGGVTAGLRDPDQPAGHLIAGPGPLLALLAEPGAEVRAGGHDRIPG